MIQLNANNLLYLIMAAQWTVLLSLIAFTGGAFVGIPIALMRVSPNSALRIIASGYIQLVQGTPLLILLFLTYFGLGILGYKLAPLVAAGLALTLYAAALPLISCSSMPRHSQPGTKPFSSVACWICQAWVSSWIRIWPGTG